MSVACEMSVQVPPRAHANNTPLRKCQECGGPMLLMAVAEVTLRPDVIWKTYECVVCRNVEEKTAPKFD